MDLRQVDLNLLVILEALIHECHVSKAASRVGLSQPAMSNALARLRALFDDPILTRAQSGMVPTVKAQELSIPLRSILKQISEQVFEAAHFDPAKDHYNFNIASTDYGAFVIGARLTSYLEKNAPNIHLNVYPLAEQTPAADLASGKFDLAIGFTIGVRPGLFAKKLYDENFVVIARKSHPSVKRTISLDRFCQLKHVIVAPWWQSERSEVDIILEEMGRSRTVAMRAPSFLIPPVVVAQTDYISSAPKRLAEMASNFVDIKLVKHPLEYPSFPIQLIWHERTHRDARMQWFRKLVVDLAQSK